MKFLDFELKEELQLALKEVGYETPTQIQKEAIPQLLVDDGDFVGLAKTGTGKTAAFLLPLLNKITPGSNKIQSLILTPTRELAHQIYEEVQKLGKHSKIKATTVYGGVSYEKQFRDLQKPNLNIVIGTPGRIMDLIDRGKLKLGNVRYLILDEADEMLNMGFKEDVTTIMKSLGEERSMWMFSATMSREIEKIISQNFNKPKFIRATDEQKSHNHIEQKFYVIRRDCKPQALWQILQSNPDIYGLVFCQTKLETRDISEFLIDKGVPHETLHGDLGQGQRDIAMKKFKTKQVKLMICTDVAARGIDVNSLTHVINMSLPNDLEVYVHRIGRTGRAGTSGTAVSLVYRNDQEKLQRLEKFMNKFDMGISRLPDLNDVVEKTVTEISERLAGSLEDTPLVANDHWTAFSKALAKVDKDTLLKLLYQNVLLPQVSRFEDMGDIEDQLLDFSNRGWRGGDRGGDSRSSGGRSGGGGGYKFRKGSGGGGNRGGGSSRDSGGERGGERDFKKSRNSTSQRPR